MSKVAIQKLRDAEAASSSVFEGIAALTDAIRQRAFWLFQSRMGENGSSLDDWLRAEREVVWTPTSELVEEEYEIRARIALPGFEPAEIELTATSDALVVRAETVRHTHRSDEVNVRFCEFSGKTAFRLIVLPAPIDLDQMSATLDKGILRVTAAKAAQPKAQTATAA